MALDLSDDIRYVKLILFLVKGGAYVAKKNILRISNSDQKSIDGYLKDNEDMLNKAAKKKLISEKQMNILFPEHSTPTEFQCWDITLYSFILLNLFRDKFNDAEELAIKKLRETRNELAHSASTTLTNVQFLRDWNRLTMILLQLTRLLTQADQDEYNSIADHIYKITDFHVAANELKPFEGSDKFVHEVITEKLKSLEQKVTDCCNRVGELETSVDELKRKQVIMVRIFVCALMPFVKDRAQAKLLETLQQIVYCDDKPLDEQRHDEVLAACHHLVSNMRDQGVDIVKVEEGSILVIIRCPTISALKNISTYFANRIYENRLIEVEKAISNYVESPVKLDMNIVLETLCSAWEQIKQDTDSKSVLLTLKGKSSKDVYDLYGKVSSSSLKSLSEALSRSVGECIELHSIIDLPDTSATNLPETGVIDLPETDVTDIPETGYTQIEQQMRGVYNNEKFTGGSRMGETRQEQFDANRVRRENTELLMEISRLCHRDDRRVENILLLGMSGAGKSALVNTVLKVIAGQYIPKAAVGKGIAASKTLSLTRHETCGVSQGDIVDGLQRDLVRKLIDKKLLPTLIDLAGKGNVNDPQMQELLELLIGGFVPPGTSIEALDKLQDDNGVGALLETIYTTSNPVWKVDKVVFVQGCHDALPVNLIECLQSVLRITNPKTGVPKYTQDVYVVITKFDLVSELPEFECGAQDDSISMEEFERKEAEIAEQFNITGALTYNRIRWVSYVDTVGHDNPHIDNIALKFVKRMVTPGIIQPTPAGPILSPLVRLRLFIKRCMRDSQISWSFVLIMILVVVVAIIIGMALAKPV